MLLLFLFTATLANAQAAGTPYSTPFGSTNVAAEGQEFWVTFGSVGGIVPPSLVYLALKVANGNSTAATVTLRFTATGQSATYSVPGNTSQLIDLGNVTPAGGASTTLTPPVNASLYATPATGSMREVVYQNTISTVTNSNTLYISSNASISVITFNTYNASTDATILLPTRIWGVEYYNLSYVGRGTTTGAQEVDMIIANQNNTNVTITNYAGATVGTATLNAGQVY